MCDNFPLIAGAGLGEKETLCVYRPLLIRHKSSFFRSYHGKSGSFRQRIRASMRRRALTRSGREEKETVMSYRPHPDHQSQPAWWQQQSTDCSEENISSLQSGRLSLTLNNTEDIQ